MIQSKIVSVQGIQTRYLESGSGDKMILFHGGGIGSSGDFWVPLIEGTRFPLSRNFHIYAPDQLGFGETDMPTTDFTLVGRAEHAFQFMNTVGIKKAHLAGLSEGGYVATRIAVFHPERTRSLIIIDSGSTAPMGNFNEDGEYCYAEWVAEQSRGLTDKETIKKLMLKYTVYYPESITNDMIERRFQLSLRPRAIEVHKKFAELAADVTERKRLDLSEKFATLQVPTLIIWGRQDRGAPLFRGLRLFELIPGSQMHIFDHAGHAVMLDHSEAFNRIVTAFCQSVPSRLQRKTL